ncbi:BTAD domain-containing putative transcriptional regulator [Streptomyces gibsoniae]|uniref:BTAD domain-containing putative transcriptional regulator n=1 Tax=Streptomyces gibsoniae TaxID=3075529 RepID=A0ABU2U7U1_9ACTN|nr:BTAD domain-containing putative transcriptional regulator [Streptomyces sp. DSM 41699]MDT0469165.1 BTAD domain-containing putative transcriptional regulator [Streptomyces sp. DSM 41699]
MQFRILGPLESMDEGRQVALGGTKQRATLGYLLLRANRVVATSQLLNVLWPVEDAPTSARKILQNAVWGLRRVLTPHHGAERPTLVTQPPGYRLAVDPDDVDLYRFQRVVEEGRAKLAAGSPQTAAQLLRDALALWRGPVLADLVEAGISWPELTAVQNSRLDVMEDYFDAELACGRQLAVLGELEAMVEDSALRERSCGQLMLALYRSGRQADALNVYGRVRHALVEDLGLEPGRELQLLHQAILTQDPSLNLPEVMHVVGEPQGMPSPVPPAQDGPDPVAAQVSPPEPSGEGERPVRTGAERDAERTLATAAGSVQRRQVAVLFVRAQLLAANDAPANVPYRLGTADADELLERVSGWMQESIEHFGGSVTATIGSVSMAVFDSSDEGDDAARAVLSALAIRDGLNTAVGSMAQLGGARPTLSLHAAVATGEALLRYRETAADAAAATISGTLVDRCHALLSRAAADGIRVCERTLERTRSMIEYVTHDSDEGVALGIRTDYMDLATIPTVERDFELGLLGDLLKRTMHRTTPHLVTVLGEAGSGKTRFLAEFGNVVQDEVNLARFQVGRTPLSGQDSIFALQAELVSALCGIQPGDSLQVALAKLERTVRGLVGEERAHRLLLCLTPLIDPSGAPAGPMDPESELDAWLHFLERTVLDRPLVLVIDDLHRAGNALLDFVSGLADFSGVPLLVVASARPELFQRRGDWGGGKHHFTSMTLEPLSDAAVDTLFDFAMASATRHTEPQRPAAGTPGGTRPVGVGERSEERRRRFIMRTLLAMGRPRQLGAPRACGAAT